MLQVSEDELFQMIGEQAVELRILRQQNAAMRQVITDSEAKAAVSDQDGPGAEEQDDADR